MSGTPRCQSRSTNTSTNTLNEKERRVLKESMGEHKNGACRSYEFVILRRRYRRSERRVHSRGSIGGRTRCNVRTKAERGGALHEWRRSVVAFETPRRKRAFGAATRVAVHTANRSVFLDLRPSSTETSGGWVRTPNATGGCSIDLII